ncbi:hypothetical protein [Erwinia sp. V71]|uniref:hypothetical protein n=1 Tax=Erwinia sp. V71 TaxID=3369424 RepID=UPI003F6304EE
MRDFRGHRRHPAKFALVFLAMAVVMTLLVMSLWNALIPDLFGLKSISFWNALGLLVLCRILFGGMGMGPMMFKMARDNRQLRDRWMRMSDDERRAFFQMHRRGRGREHWRGGRDTPPQGEGQKPADNE